MLFNWTKQDKMRDCSRKSCFSTLRTTQKQTLNSLISCHLYVALKKKKKKDFLPNSPILPLKSVLLNLLCVFDRRFRYSSPLPPSPGISVSPVPLWRQHGVNRPVTGCGRPTRSTSLRVHRNLFGNCQETETCMARACHTPWKPLQNYPSGHLGGLATPWSAEERLNGQYPLFCTSQNCSQQPPAQKTGKASLDAESSFMSPRRPYHKELNWTDALCSEGSSCTPNQETSYSERIPLLALSRPLIDTTLINTSVSLQ